jgi:hypothetical protein
MNTFIFLHQVVGSFGELKCIYPLVPSLSSSRHWRMKFNTGFYRCYFWLQQCGFGMKRGPVRRTPNPTCCLNCPSHHEGYSAIRIRPRHIKTLKSPTWAPDYHTCPKRYTSSQASWRYQPWNKHPGRKLQIPNIGRSSLVCRD